MALQANGSDLNCAAPEQVPLTLRYAAQAYRDSVADLQASWQDDSAGMVWWVLADELERSANRCDAIIAKHFK